MMIVPAADAITVFAPTDVYDYHEEDGDDDDCESYGADENNDDDHFGCRRDHCFCSNGRGHGKA